jgi:hypothetical protein
MTVKELDPNDPLHTIVEINGVELTSREVIALRAVIDMGVKIFDAVSSVETTAASLRRIQQLLANGE